LSKKKIQQPASTGMKKTPWSTRNSDPSKLKISGPKDRKKITIDKGGGEKEEI